MVASTEIRGPRYEGAEVVVPAPDRGPGNWAGGASCVRVDGTFWMAYRLRRPLDSGRGGDVVVAKSTDGVNFKPVCEVGREDLGAAALERPEEPLEPEDTLKRLRAVARGGVEAEARPGVRRPEPPPLHSIVPGPEPQVDRAGFPIGRLMVRIYERTRLVVLADRVNRLRPAGRRRW